MVLRGSRSALWFDPTGSVTARYSARFSFSHRGGSYSMAAPNGEASVFNDFSSANPGLLPSISTAGGQMLNVTSYAPNTNLGIGEVPPNRHPSVEKRRPRRTAAAHA